MVYLPWCILLNNSPLVHHCDFISKSKRFILVMSNKNTRYI